MKKIRRHLALMMLVALVTTACTATGGDGATSTHEPGTTSPGTTAPLVNPPVDAELARADVMRALSTDVTQDELTALVAGDTRFALDLFQVAAAGGDNTLLSPYSIATALAMTYAGARGATAAEIADVLHLTTRDDRVHTIRSELDLRLNADNQPAVPSDEREPFSIEIANSLWAQQGYPFLEDFLGVLAENYGAGMNLVDFAAAAEQARVTINSWVDEQTHGRIVDLIPEGVINSATRLVLTNAIWFKASWASQFDPGSTTRDAFTTGAGADVTVPFMHGGGMLQYSAGDGYQSVRLPYAGDAAMVIILPNTGRYDDVVEGLTPEFLDGVAAGASVSEVNLAMPKFEFSAEFSLKKAFAELGMSAAFTDPSADGADFTGMTDRRELFLQDVIHQAFITVDEQGTEAAAATAVVVGLTSAGTPPIAMTIDRPFVFTIEQSSTGEILFIGQVTDPS